MKFFFYDFEKKGGSYGAPEDFIMSIMVSLDSTIYTVGTNIVASGQLLR